MMSNNQQVYSAEFYTVQFKCQETGVFKIHDIQKKLLMDENNTKAITRCLLGETCMAVSH